MSILRLLFLSHRQSRKRMKRILATVPMNLVKGTSVFVRTLFTRIFAMIPCWNKWYKRYRLPPPLHFTRVARFGCFYSCTGFCWIWITFRFMIVRGFLRRGNALMLASLIQGHSSELHFPWSARCTISSGFFA